MLNYNCIYFLHILSIYKRELTGILIEIAPIIGILTMLSVLPVNMVISVIQVFFTFSEMFCSFQYKGPIHIFQIYNYFIFLILSYTVQYSVNLLTSLVMSNSFFIAIIGFLNRQSCCLRMKRVLVLSANRDAFYFFLAMLNGEDYQYNKVMRAVILRLEDAPPQKIK